MYKTKKKKNPKKFNPFVVKHQSRFNIPCLETRNKNWKLPPSFRSKREDMDIKGH